MGSKPYALHAPGVLRADTKSGGDFKFPFMTDECCGNALPDLVNFDKEGVEKIEMNAIYNYELVRLKKLLKSRTGSGDQMTRIHYGIFMSR